MVTREHGSWAVVFVPLMSAVGVAGQHVISEFLLFFAALSGFMMYVPLQTILRSRINDRPSDERRSVAEFWVVVFGIVGLICILALIFLGFPFVPFFALAASVFFFGNFLLVRFFQKTLASDLVAVAGLTLGASAMYYTAVARIDKTALSLWTLNFLFFGGSVFYVHMKLHASGLKKDTLTFSEKFSVGKWNVLYHLVLVIIVVALTTAHFAPQLAILAFVPVIIHAIIGTIRLSSKVRYKALGYALLAQSVFFCVLVIVVGRH
jgi:hypothetical protein